MKILLKPYITGHIYMETNSLLTVNLEMELTDFSGIFKTFVVLIVKYSVPSCIKCIPFNRLFIDQK